MQAAYLEGSWMQGVNLMSANLQGADLKGARIQGANLMGAQMLAADLTKTHMQAAHLTLVHMQGANLKEARMHGAFVSRKMSAFLNFSLSPGFFRECLKERRNQPTQLNLIIGDRYGSSNASIPIKKNQLGVIFTGELAKDGVELLEGILAECLKNEWVIKEKVDQIKKALKQHEGTPTSYELPKDSGAITGILTNEEADRILAEYEESINKTEI